MCDFVGVLISESLKGGLNCMLKGWKFFLFILILGIIIKRII